LFVPSSIVQSSVCLCQALLFKVVFVCAKLYCSK